MGARLALLVVLALMPRVSWGSAPELFGMGPRPIALAGAGVADGDGWDQTYTNPAGLVDARRRSLSIGYLGARYRLSLDGTSRDVAASNGVLLGAVLPVPFGGVLRDRVALGLAFYFPTDFVTRARAPYPETPRLPLYDDRTQVVSVVVSGGFHLHERVDVGVGVLALAALVGRIVISSDPAGNATTTSTQELVTRMSPIVGVRVRATRWLRMGLAYRGESKAEFGVDIVPSLGPRLPLQIPVLGVHGVAQFDPHQIHAEAAFHVRRATFFVGLGWKHWSAYPLPAENATAGAPPQPAPGFHDTAVARVAVEAQLPLRHGITLTGRAGYSFESSPAGADAGVYIDGHRNVLGLGGGVAFQRGRLGLHLDVHGQYNHVGPAARTGGDFGVFGGTVGIDL